MRRGVGQPVKEEQTLKATTDTSWILAEPRMHLENCSNAAATETQPSGFGDMKCSRPNQCTDFRREKFGEAAAWEVN